MEVANLRIKLRKNQYTIPVENLTSEVTNLEILGDSIEKIPSLKHLTKCVSLLLVCPQLGQLDELPENLKILKIKGGHTYPKNLPQSIKILQISGIKCSLNGIELPRGIINLDLSSNELMTLADIELNSSLTRLNLDHNQLSNLPESLYQNKSLLHLSLDGNPLTDEEKNKLHKTFGIWF